ncbi:MAG: transglutaminase domain-containing protein [Ferruginibacter sp.]
MTIKNSFLIIFFFLFVSAAFAQVVEGVDYVAILRSASYDPKDNKIIPAEFTYESSNDTVLVTLRKKYKLDSIAGFGNEVSRILNLLHWVHNTVKHDGVTVRDVGIINADEILKNAITNDIGVSCGELAITLNDCYLAMGVPSRKIYCFPKDSLHKDADSHVINIVYISSKKKWIWVDPTHDAYVMNEKGALLSIEEVRERLIKNKPLIVNPDANWNRRVSDTKENYLNKYMAKNLYRMYCPIASEYGTPDFNTNKSNYVELVPADYYKQSRYKDDKRIITSNPKQFWALPGDN